METYLNNIAEFAKINHIDCIDQVSGNEEQINFAKGLLMNLEFLAHKWQLIEPSKYHHRLEDRNVSDGRLPGHNYIQNFFDIKTFTLAQSAIFAKTNSGKELLIHKECSLAGAKLL